MNYHIIRTDDMLNGSGLRVVLFLSGCEHHCQDCHNPETWDAKSGKPFTKEVKDKLFELLDKEYIAGLTLSGGDPLFIQNLNEVFALVEEVKEHFPLKNIWIYTGYTFEEILHNKIRYDIISRCDVLCEGRFEKDKVSIETPWVGSTNQRVIDIPTSLKNKKIVLWKQN